MQPLSCPPLAGRHKRATCPLSEEGAQGRPIGLSIGVLLPQKIETLLEAPLVRIPVNPSGCNGLRKPSQLMADRLFTVPTAAVGAVMGILESGTLAELDLPLRSWLELP